jgi:hypothetical protein
MLLLIQSGTRLFFRSTDAAIWWFSGVASIPRTSSVVPILHTNNRVNIAAELMDGHVISGQSEISHPHIPDNGTSLTVDKTNTSQLTSPIKKYSSPYILRLLQSFPDCCHV